MEKHVISGCLSTSREDHLVAWFAALAVCIHVLEAGLPSPIPGVKPGLANVVTVLVLYLYGWRLAAWVATMRIVVGSLIIGSFLSPGFFLSISGGMCAVLALGIISRIPKQWISPIGASIAAAIAHMSGQFTIAYYLFIPHQGLFKLLPFLLTAALIFGLASGFIANWVLKQVTP